MKYIIKNIDDYKSSYINNFKKKINSKKQKSIDIFKTDERKKQSIVGEILLNKLLKNYDIDYNNINFFTNCYGKPYIKNYNLFYNISHSYQYVITTISDKEIGIDIEKIRNTSIKNIEQFATEKEKKYILSTTTDIETRLFKIYTLKEAYFKMLGKDLKNILNVEFEIINNKVTCSDKNVKCDFINNIEGYIIAYCEKI